MNKTITKYTDDLRKAAKQEELHRLNLIGESCYVHFDDQTWPVKSKALSDIEWRIRYGHYDKSDIMVAASVISAYQELLTMNKDDREKVISNMFK